MNKKKDKLLSGFFGEYCCRNDEKLTLVGDTAGLTGLFGCTNEEIGSVYHNSLLELIAPEFREDFVQELREQLAVGVDIELLFPVWQSDGVCVWFLNRACLFEDEDGEEYLNGVFVDVTKMKLRHDAERLAARALKEQAEQDSLTKIYNARTARKMAEKYLLEHVTDPDCVLLIIDLDDFKRINDRYGHMFGDAVLVQAAKTIKHLFRSKDIVGRIGGEEFMVLMKDVKDREIVEQRLKQLNELFRDILKDQLGGRHLSCSIGAAFAPDHGKSYFELFSHADQALYYAKDLGKDRYVFYDSDSTKARDEKNSHRFTNYDAEAFRGYIDFE